MSETKFTPGPWHWVGIGDEIYVETEHTKYIASLKQYGYSSEETQEANANLIAAAPELYAELEAAMNVFRFYQGHHAAKSHSDKEQTNKQYADRIAKVLAKARGEA